MPDLSSFSIKKACPIMILGLRHWKRNASVFLSSNFSIASAIQKFMPIYMKTAPAYAGAEFS